MTFPLMFGREPRVQQCTGMWQMSKLRPGEGKPPAQGPKETLSSSPCSWSHLLESDFPLDPSESLLRGPCASYFPEEGPFCSLTWTVPEPREGPAGAPQPVAPNPHGGGEVKGERQGHSSRQREKSVPSCLAFWGLREESGNRGSARPMSLPTCLPSGPSCCKLDLPQLG